MAAGDPSRRADPLVSARFRISAAACPQVLNRLLGYLAQQDRAIDRLQAVRSREEMRVRFVIGAIDAHRAEILAAKMRNIVTVTSVALSFDMSHGSDEYAARK